MNPFAHILAPWLTCVGVLLALLPSSPLVATELGPEATAALGQKAYNDGQYRDAIAAFEELISRGNVSGPLFYDLGNAYYRAGDLGKAVLAYRRAELYMPRDEDLAANLSYLRQQTTDDLEATSGELGLRDLVFWYDALSLQEQTWLAIILSALAWGGLFLWRMRRRGRLPLGVPILLVASLTAAVTAGVRFYEGTTHPGAVVLHPEITARSGMDIKSVPLFYLHEGAEVRAHVGADPRWSQIELPDGRRGWVESQFIGLVVPKGTTKTSDQTRE